MAAHASQPVSGVVLAAGGSRRLQAETLKQLIAIEGETLVRRACRVALESRLAEVLVVVGCGEDEVREAVEGLAVRVVANPSWQQGQSTSVRRGLAAVGADARGALFIPCDQPWLDAATIDLLIAAFAERGSAATGFAIVPTSAGRRGAPVLFGRDLFVDLSQITGDRGGSQILDRLQDRVVEIEVPDPRALDDIDTPDQLARLLGKPAESVLP